MADNSITFPQASVCARCQGGCCKKTPGIYHPDDLKGKLSSQSIADMVVAGELVIAAYEWIFEETYYLRPPMVDAAAPIGHVHTQRAGTCANLTDKGCKLSFENRPYECRTLEPVESGEAGHNCVQHSYRVDIMDEWLRFQGNIRNALRKLKLREHEEEQ